jgi:hypothetical protein
MKKKKQKQQKMEKLWSKFIVLKITTITRYLSV